MFKANNKVFYFGHLCDFSQRGVTSVIFHTR